MGSRSDFPDHVKIWEVEGQYMFGPDILVAPVLYQGMRKRNVYLQEGKKWTDANTGKTYEGGQTIECDASLEVIPDFTTAGTELKIH